MTAHKLTKALIDAQLPAAREYFVWDADLKGFALRVSPNGLKSFFAQYRVGGGRSGRTRRYAIGRFGALTLDEARREAKAVLGAVALGRDPSGERSSLRQEMTVSHLIDQYDAEGTTHLKPREKKQRLARLRHHIRPLLGTRRVTSVRVSDIEQMMRDIAKGKTRVDKKVGPRQRIIVRGGEGAAAKAVSDFSALFAYAVRIELIETNPCSPVKKLPARRHNRFLTLEELTRLGDAIQKLRASGVNPKAMDITMLWVLTGCRRNEISALRWSEVDFEGSCLRLNDSKTGASRRALAAPAAAILHRIERCASLFVFPSERGNSFFQGTKKIWPKLVELADLPGVTPHTLRHTVGSAAVSSGETLAMTGALLGHTDHRSTSIYAHMQAHPAKAAADRVMAPIAAAIVRE
jgi:integrase